MIDTAAYSDASMRRGSLSFYLAARFFPRAIRSDVMRLYAWCRYVDDLVDEGGDASDEERHFRLEALTSASLGESGEGPPAIEAFHAVRGRRQIAHGDVQEFLAGMAMDCREVRIKNDQELDLYCHRVAGVVGQMMCRVMKVGDEGASRYADDLGKAMQLTNICRDVAEDFGRGRVYLPATLLARQGISRDANLMAPSVRPVLVDCAEELLARADLLYASGAKGLVYLPLRASLAVAAAGEIYRAIGQEVRRRGARAWDERVWIPGWKKILLALRGVTKALGTLPTRARRKREPLLRWGDDANE